MKKYVPKANIPTKAEPKIVTQTVKLLEYRALPKTENKTTFKARLNELFDITDKNALQILSVREKMVSLMLKRKWWAR